MEKIRITWRPFNVGDKQYYYSFVRRHNRFYCIEGQYIHDGGVIDEDFIFQVRLLKDFGPRVSQDLIVRMCHLFPELTLDNVKTALNNY